MHPASRKTDPESSHIAEREITGSGSRENQQAKILEVVKLNPGRTSRELTYYCDLDRYQIARRLSDLNDANFVYQGPIRKCGIGGRKSVTWFPVPLETSMQLKLF